MWPMPAGTSAQVYFPSTLMALRPNAAAQPLLEAEARNEHRLSAVGCSGRLCKKSNFRKCCLTKSTTCKARMLQKGGFHTVWRCVRRSCGPEVRGSCECDSGFYNSRETSHSPKIVRSRTPSTLVSGSIARSLGLFLLCLGGLLDLLKHEIAVAAEPVRDRYELLPLGLIEAHPATALVILRRNGFLCCSCTAERWRSPVAGNGREARADAGGRRP